MQLRSVALTEQEGGASGKAGFEGNHRVFRGGEISRGQKIIKDKHYLSSHKTLWEILVNFIVTPLKVFPTTPPIPPPLLSSP